ncbi:ATP-binding protein [Propylenella binzhouense]|uniref:ATP-binding protein n=1 Tax=Propylenella binzhouense TaxID=2555902 RepID=A0A964T6P6_9HYPH|nr:ATP-binding protein [Propylenella binzhouense]MYZ49120.1 ATP-binding protein [Propylenella binzhouense]
MKSTVEMGAAGGAPALIDLEELLATRLLVQGNSGSGKSHLLRRLLEQSAGSVQQIVIDPEGDFVTLAERFDHVAIDAAAVQSDLQRIARRIRQHRVSAVLALDELEVEGQLRAAAAFLTGLFDADREHWYPALVVVDEAQLFAPALSGEGTDEARRLSLGAMTNLMCRGRKRGLAGIVATQRLAKLAKNVAAEASNFLMGRTFLDIDMARAADLLGMERRQAEMFRDLERGQFVGLGPALSRKPLPIRIGPVETSGRSGSPVLIPLPEPPGEAATELIFTASPDEAESERNPVPQRPRPATGDVLARLAAQRPEAACEREPEIDPAEAAAAVEEILAAMAAEPELAGRDLPLLFQDFSGRCRKRGLGRAVPPLSEFRRRFAIARAGASAETRGRPEWEAALAHAAGLSEDLQGLFLYVARLALEAAPAPGDGDLGDHYGTRSPGRLKRVLAHLEERGDLVCHVDAAGRRVLALPRLGIETAPGTAAAPEHARRALRPRPRLDQRLARQ